MAHKILVSKDLVKLNKRVLGLQAIDSKLVLQNGLSVDGGTNLATTIQTALNSFNLMQSALDEKRYEIAQLNKQASDFSKGIFDTVKSQFGDDSMEYEKVGGTRRSLRAKAGTKAAKAAKAKTAKIAKSV